MRECDDIVVQVMQSCAKRTVSPVSPDKLLEGVDSDVVRVHVFGIDLALLEIALVYLVGMSGARGR